MVGAGVLAGQEGCASLGIVATDIPAAQQAAQFIQPGFKASGQTNTQITPVPVAASDFAPIVTASTRDTDCIALVINPQLVREYLTACAQAGKDQTLFGFAGALSMGNIEATSGADGPPKGVRDQCVPCSQ